MKAFRAAREKITSAMRGGENTKHKLQGGQREGLQSCIRRIS